MSMLGKVVAGVCGGKRWDECWCDKKSRDAGCRDCQTYQLFWGLTPTCGDSGKFAGKPVKGEFWKQELDEDLLELQKKLKAQGPRF